MMVPVTFGSLTTPQRIALGILALLIGAYSSRWTGSVSPRRRSTCGRAATPTSRGFGPGSWSRLKAAGRSGRRRCSLRDLTCRRRDQP